MQFAFFKIPVSGAAPAAEELNRFLRGHRVIAVKKEFVPAGGDCEETVFLVACIPMKELSFEVRQEDEGGFSASCELADGVIATQGDTWKELEEMVLDAVSGYFADRADKPAHVRLHLERDEVLPVSA